MKGSSIQTIQECSKCSNISFHVTERGTARIENEPEFLFQFAFLNVEYNIGSTVEKMAVTSLFTVCVFGIL
jgi:hypothetical protein